MTAIGISTNYRRIDRSEIEKLDMTMLDAWKDAVMPQRQFEMCLKDEMARFRTDDIIEVFASFIRCLSRCQSSCRTLLDVGAACAHYGEIALRIMPDLHYTAVDFSEAFRDFAEKLYPDIDYDVADSRALPYHDEYFDIVLSSANILHVVDYEQAIREAIRVAKRYVIFHRTPVWREATAFYLKDAYGVSCVEIHFNERELLQLFADNKTRLLYVTDTSLNRETRLAQRSYLLAKPQVSIAHMSH